MRNLFFAGGIQNSLWPYKFLTKINNNSQFFIKANQITLNLIIIAS